MQINKDPKKTVTLLKAIQWTRIAWNDCVTNATISRCFWKSTITKKPSDIGSTINESIVEREALRVQIAKLPGIADALTIDEFVLPLEEQVIDEDEDIMEAIIEIYGADEDENEEEEEEEEEPLPSIAEAIRALETLQRFELARADESRSIRALDDLTRDLMALRINSKIQGNLDSFFVEK